MHVCGQIVVKSSQTVFCAQLLDLMGGLLLVECDTSIGFHFTFHKSSYLLGKVTVSKLPYTELSFSSIRLTGVSWPPVKHHKKIISILLKMINQRKTCIQTMIKWQIKPVKCRSKVVEIQWSLCDLATVGNQPVMLYSVQLLTSRKSKKWFQWNALEQPSQVSVSRL